MNQELKQKAYQLLIDKIDVEGFENFLYKLVDNSEMKNNSLLFDLVTVNYKSNSYRKELFRFIESFCIEEELTILEIYKNCLKLKNKDKGEEFFKSLENISNIYIESDYTFDILYPLYWKNNELESLREGFGFSSIEKIIKDVEEYSKLVIKEFHIYREEENWFHFLKESEDMEFDSNFFKSKKGNIKT